MKYVHTIDWLPFNNSNSFLKETETKIMNN